MASSIPLKVSARRLGEVRSGSGKMASKPMVTAPSSVSRVTMRASTVRGQGHWPTSARLASSTSTISTGYWVGTLGFQVW